MFLIRQTIGFVYILAILILAFDVLYGLFNGFVPIVLKEQISFTVTMLQDISNTISMPVAYIVNLILSYLPISSKEFFPVTDTGIMQAQIKWVPIFSLFIYTNIIKYINDTFLKHKIDNIHKNYNNQQSDNNRNSL